MKKFNESTKRDDPPTRARSQFEPGPWNPLVWVSKAHRRGSSVPLIRWPWMKKDGSEF